MARTNSDADSFLGIPLSTTAPTNGQVYAFNDTTFEYEPTTVGSGTVTSVAALTLGTTGTDLSSSVANGTTTPVITLNVPTASASNRGVLSAADWSTFNGKQAALGYTAENAANKENSTIDTSTTKYPTVNLLKSGLDAKQNTMTKAAGSDVDTGTDDAKYVTSKALKDAKNVPSVAPGTSGNVLTSNGTDWTSGAPAVSATSTTTFTNKTLTDAKTIQSINPQTGTTYTFVLTDASKLVTGNNGSTQTYTVPPNDDVAFPIGTQIDVIQIGDGKITLAQGSGVTISSKGGNKSTGGKFVGVSLIKVATNTRYLVGDLIA